MAAFFSGSSAFSHRNKIQKLQLACLRSILGALKSTPSTAIDIEVVCQPLELRCKLFAGKFLLRDLSKRIYNTFIDVFSAWRYVSRSVPVLASVAHYLSATQNYIITSNKLPLYEADFSSLVLAPIINNDKGTIMLEVCDCEGCADSHAEF